MILPIALGLAGCGGGHDERYDELLRGLKRAAFSGASFEAVRRSKNLEPTERATVQAFCEIADHVVVNHENQTVPARIEGFAEQRLPGFSEKAVRAAIREMGTIIVLKPFSFAAARRYMHACFGSG